MVSFTASTGELIKLLCLEVGGNISHISYVVINVAVIYDNNRYVKINWIENNICAKINIWINADGD
jgi:hypothetical protein